MTDMHTRYLPLKENQTNPQDRKEKMDFFDLIQSRYSVRAYRPEPVEKEKLNQVLEAARLAPTAANRQPFRLYVARSEGRQSELLRVYPREWFTQAPLVICAAGLPGRGWVRSLDGKNYTDVDVTIAMDHLILAAAALGLGTCWIAAFDPDAARKVFNLPAEAVPVVLTPLGYPADQAKPKERQGIEELVTFLEG
jgi:nitroreductase